MVLHATNLDLMFPKSLHEKKWLRMRITWNPCNAKKNAVEFRGLWCRKRCYHFVDGQVLEMVSWEVRLTVQFWRDIQTHQPNPWLTFYQICELYMVDPMFFEGTHAETILSIHAVDRFLPKKTSDSTFSVLLLIGGFGHMNPKDDSVKIDWTTMRMNCRGWHITLKSWTISIDHATYDSWRNSKWVTHREIKVSSTSPALIFYNKNLASHERNSFPSCMFTHFPNRKCFEHTPTL